MENLTPSFVLQYEKKLKDQSQIKRELAELKLMVTGWLQTVPKQSYQLHDSGKLRIAKQIIKQTIKPDYVEASLVTFLVNTQSMNQENAKAFAQHATAFIWDSRSEKTVSKLVRTTGHAKTTVTDTIMTK